MIISFSYYRYFKITSTSFHFIGNIHIIFDTIFILWKKFCCFIKKETIFKRSLFLHCSQIKIQLIKINKYCFEFALITNWFFSFVARSTSPFFLTIIYSLFKSSEGVINPVLFANNLLLCSILFFSSLKLT